MRISDWSSDVCSSDLIAVTVSSTSWRSNASLVKPAGSIKPTLSPGRSRGGFRGDEGADAVTWAGNANVEAIAPKLWMAVRLLSIPKDIAASSAHPAQNFPFSKGIVANSTGGFGRRTLLSEAWWGG